MCKFNYGTSAYRWWILRLRLALITTLLLTFPGSGHPVQFDPDWGTVGVFTNAASCARCHRASTDMDPNIPAVMRQPLEDTGTDVSPSYQWQHSVMAHAFDDPYFKAAVEDEVSEFPALAGFIEDKCLNCHSPIAHTHAHQTNTDLDADGFYRFASAAMQDHAREGISCTLCHQIKADNLGTAASFSGHFSIAAAGDLDAFTIYGPYQNPHINPMLPNSGYTPAFGGHMTVSDHCATCHTLFTPVVDVNTGTPTGDEFLEQGPFQEWQNSDFVTGAISEQQCQDCHMPDPAPGAYQTRIAVRPDGSVNMMWDERAPYFTHGMVGANTHILALLRDNRALLEIDGSTSIAGFEEKIAETRDLLGSRTASLSITRGDIVGNEALIDVRIVNLAGHKLPTSYPSRRMWLHMTVRDAANNIVFESGRPDADGRISTDTANLHPDCLARTKPPGFTNDGCYEPHHDVIDDPARIAIYEAVLGDTNDHVTHVLLHANSYLKNNRLLPQGFENATATLIEPQTLPIGTAADGDFNIENNVEGSGTDTVHYRVALNDPGSQHTVEVRLLFQSIRPSFIEGLLSSGSHVTNFKTMVAQTPPLVEVLASANGVVTAATGGSSSSGCSLGNARAIDPLLPALALFALVGLAWRSRRPWH